MSVEGGQVWRFRVARGARPRRVHRGRDSFAQRTYAQPGGRPGDSQTAVPRHAGFRLGALHARWNREERSGGLPASLADRGRPAARQARLSGGEDHDEFQPWASTCAASSSAKGPSLGRSASAIGARSSSCPSAWQPQSGRSCTGLLCATALELRTQPTGPSAPFGVADAAARAADGPVLIEGRAVVPAPALLGDAVIEAAGEMVR